MKSFFKKTAVVVALTAAMMSLQAPQSQAIIGVATGNLILDCIGFAGIFGTAVAAQGNKPPGLPGMATRHEVWAVLISLFILDDKTQMPAHLGVITPAIAEKLGYDPQADKEKIDAYNEALPAINAIHQQIIQAASNDSSLHTDADIQAFARAKWAEMTPKANLDADAVSVLQKIQG